MKIKHIIFIIASTWLFFTSMTSASQSPTAIVYDNLNRLIQVIHADGSITAYQYDAVGNRTRKIITTEVTLPVVETAAAAEITSNSAIVGGNVISSGGATVNERGVYWGASPNPETTGTKLQVGSGIGSFSTLLSGLAHETTYYVKAYATNSEGTAFGQERQFTTLPEILPITYFLQLMVSPSNAGIATGEGYYEEGGQIPLNAIPNDGYEFVNWTDEDGIVISAAANFVYTMPADDVTLTANFVEAGTGYAQLTITVICDLTEIPIEGAFVDLFGFEYGFWGETDQNGQVILPDVPPGQYDLNVFKDGYDWYWLDFEMGDEDMEIIARLDPYYFALSLAAIPPEGGTVEGSGEYFIGEEVYISAYEAENWIFGRWIGDTIFLQDDIEQPLNMITMPGHVLSLQARFYSTIYPTVEISLVNNSQPGQTIIDAIVFHDPGVDNSERGFVWSTFENPDLEYNEGSNVDQETGMGAFFIELSGLLQNTRYYVRAYATNSAGTSYSDQYSFHFWDYNDIVTDIDGNVYQTVIIGEQEWMSENLRVTRDAYGNNITRYCYDNNPTNCSHYGGLYTWHTIMNGESSSINNPSGVQGICPDGWHLPSDAEWTQLVDYIVEQGHPNEWGIVTGAGNALKSCRQISSPLGSECNSSEHPRWDSYEENHGFNEFGFSAFPGGHRRSNGNFYVLGNTGAWWSATETSAQAADCRTLSYSDGIVDNTYSYRVKVSGFSVRCVKDETTTVIIPNITTTSIFDITSSSATSGGNVTDDGGAAVTARGVCWSTSPNPTIDDNFTMDGNGTGEFTSYIAGLTPATTYYVRAYATNSAGTGYGEELSFTTDEAGAFSCGDLLLDPRDGNTYTTVLIGEQCWMAENLAYLPEVNSPNQGSVTEPRYYVHGYSGNSVAEAKATTSYQIFGALYNWTASLQVCPTDWHLPFADEWMQLIGYIEAQGFPNIDLPNSAGNALKSCRQVNSPLGADCSTLEHPRWNENNTHYGFDEFGFSAFPGSNRSSSGLFGSFGLVGQWWSATAGPNISARRFYLISSGGRLNYDNVPRETGFSIRCLRDESAQVNLPSVTTFSILNLTESTATSGGNVTDDGGAAVTARGVCWSTSQNPTIDDNITMDGSGTGEFTSYITGLTPATTYYVRAYATNSVGTGYGEELSFTTLNEVLLPTLITQNAIDISENSAVSGGSVFDDGGAEVTARGVVWSTSGEPSLEINEGLTQDGAGMGEFISYLTGLSAGTTYYVRAYATNSEGTAYGNEVTFTTLSSETYFNAVWQTPFNPMTFYIIGANIDEIPMQAGSEIGLFDIDPITGQEICVGAGVLVEPLVGDAYLEMIASMDDGTNPDQANGFTPGNAIIYKLWNSEIGEMSNVIANYPYPGYDESYTALGSAFVELLGLTVITQQISLQEGWNMMSFRVMPENWDMMHIVQPLIDQGLLFKVLDETGGSIFHLPFPPPNGQWSNTIGEMANTEGYYIKVHDHAMLDLEGYPVEAPLDIPLINGWNMISYPCENEQNAMAVVQPLIDAGILFKVIDEAGGSIFHLPFPPPNGQWSNTIGNFKSDKGYYLKATSNATLTIGCDGEAYQGHIPGNAPSRKSEFFVPVWQNNPFMPMHVALMPSENMIAGDEIGIFDGDVCVGSIVFDGDHNLPLIITTSQHEPDNSSVNGFTIGNEISIRYYDISTGNVSPAEIEIIDGSGFFDALGTLIGKLKATATNVTITSADAFAVDVVPNPFFDKLYLKLHLPDDGAISVECFNMLGQQVSLVQEMPLGKGMNRLTLETAHLEAGAYLLKVIYRSGESEQSNSFKVLKHN
jgi:uncharacterized protein (TIGR02145 family)